MSKIRSLVSAGALGLSSMISGADAPKEENSTPAKAELSVEGKEATKKAVNLIQKQLKGFLGMILSAEDAKAFLEKVEPTEKAEPTKVENLDKEIPAPLAKLYTDLEERKAYIDSAEGKLVFGTVDFDLDEFKQSSVGEQVISIKKLYEVLFYKPESFIEQVSEDDYDSLSDKKLEDCEGKEIEQKKICLAYDNATDEVAEMFGNMGVIKDIQDIENYAARIIKLDKKLAQEKAKNKKWSDDFIAQAKKDLAQED